MAFTINLAGTVIEIDNKYEYIEQLCREHIVTDQKAEMFVFASSEDIEKEKAMTSENFPDYVYESTCIHRAVVTRMVSKGVILIHSAVIAVDGEAYAFLAKSGVGKSTHISMWKEHFGERAVIVNGDKPMYSFENGVLTAHGSPWKGKELWGSNISMPVKAICLLERGEVNEISTAPQQFAVDKLLGQVLFPSNAEDVASFMAILDRIVKGTPIYRLKCNISEEAAVVAFNGMN